MPLSQNLDGVNVCCAVFQIRRGGYKGLLIRYLDRDFEFLCNYQNTLLGRNRAGSDVVIAFRESMLKYEGGPTMLEINDYASRPNHARLNEGFILLLLTNGVSLDVSRTKIFLLHSDVVRFQTGIS